MTLETATFEELNNNLGLYSQAMNYMKWFGMKVNCNCSEALKSQNINNFLKNKVIIMDKVNMIKKRTIKPKWNGIIWSSKTKQHYNSRILTDNDIVEIVKNGYLSEKMFEFPENFEVEEKKEEQKKETIEITDEETKAEITKQKRINALAKAREAKKNKSK